MTENVQNQSTYQQPPWHEPHPRPSAPTLHVLNTLTRTKVPFRPESGDNRIRWYSCGPTVYDSAHLGHARNYVTFDILRRILQDYFNYDVLYIMNITDIDDKIILRARQAFLLKEYYIANPVVTDKLIAELTDILCEFGMKKLNVDVDQDDWCNISTSAIATDDAKGQMYIEIVSKAKKALSNAKKGASAQSLLDGFQDILAPYLDELKGATVNDPKLSRHLAAHWENDFLEDMQNLGVLPADIMTRVSEYIPEIIEYVQGILKNGFAYVTEEGSVYFNVAAFKASPNHHYAKLCPWNAGNAKLFEEGEGALGMKLSGKRDPRDFALWKASKAGEPSWDSPWGKGRPGWHIECSAMAGAVAPGVLDVHSGGIDLAFPHHDNELAQAEAYTGCPQWVNYFMHAGHVHIEGHKMSKSLKNFITIKECLEKYTSRQLRIMFLQHQWSSPVTFKEASMLSAISVESTLVNYFANVAHRLENFFDPGYGKNNFGALEKEFMIYADKVKDNVHSALCDSFDTPNVLSELLDLVNKSNVYVKKTDGKANPEVLLYAAKYIRKILTILGITWLPAFEGMKTETNSPCAVDSERLNGILKAVVDYRWWVRNDALGGEDRLKYYLGYSDDLRVDLAKLGVIIEDHEDKKSTFKLVEPKKVELKPKDEILELQKKQAERQAAKEAKARIAPSELFKGNPVYSKFDERGVPTHDASGVELSKNARKKLVKEYEAQVSLHASSTH